MMRSSEKHQGVKAMQMNRDRIKERIQEKHQLQRQRVRDRRLSGLRKAEDGETSGDATGAGILWTPVTGHGEVGSSSTYAPDTALCCNPDGSLTVPAVQDWSDIGHEFGVNIHDVDVMGYLLALEEEIRQEQVFQFYDQTNGNEWEDYFRSLTY
ncbi:putative phosphatidylcholine:ceramide cholinephosphotransferase 2 [Leishmania major strain Friedlin]|uniref:Putative phosphatidylcholine:ceramide cholinephosphotransferase 2 n=1 Tax=Leishmania major TaxID=5664 RepID=E9AFW5_LEIMA|nr:putative phosphatidylcholine:ceramide cholinephosphotransferase 2 [Leishmania major strain Friedlin]CAG9582847.1 hypothetical_protein_-_conserved [Leishmania major strain Friedlin]CBZ13120.1 putative phosphatidylcholine:ceramide cholinephosphotransferase 2 [Leishmania major strain Friedlin]|eukprot:XP_003722885.1 putative phosphatidylcholine:ceramide cholinephosphotransferase 2 [Leishmania major strain Friedlin]